MEKISILGIITARAGSKGLPRKNIYPVAGKPLIAWSIAASLRSTSIDRTVVSTDSEEYREIALRYGAEDPFLRPPEFAQDDTSGVAPVIHAVEWLAQNEKYVPDYVMLLQPTSPLRTADDIDAAVRLALDRNAVGVVSVCRTSKHPYWLRTISPTGELEALREFSDKHLNRRQDVPDVFALNGAIYLTRRDVLLSQRTVAPKGALAYVMPEERSLDVDTLFDIMIINVLLADAKRV